MNNTAFSILEGRRMYRSLVSYGFISILTAVALQEWINWIKNSLNSPNLGIPFWSLVEKWGTPFIFFLTVIRFFMGNIIHIRVLEADSERFPTI